MLSREYFYPRQQVANENLNNLSDDNYNIIKDFMADWAPSTDGVILTYIDPPSIVTSTEMKLFTTSTTTIMVSGGTGYVAQNKVSLPTQTIDALTSKDYDGSYIQLPAGGGGTAYTRVDTIGVRLLETFTNTLNVNFIDERNNIYNQDVPTRVTNSAEIVWIQGVRNPILPVAPLSIPSDVLPIYNVYLKDSTNDYTYSITSSDPGILATNCGYIVDLRGQYLYNPTTNAIAQPSAFFGMFSQIPAKGIVDSVVIPRDGTVNKIYANLDIDGGTVLETMKDIGNWYTENAGDVLRMDPINFLTGSYGIAFNKTLIANNARYSKTYCATTAPASAQFNITDLTLFSDVYLPTIPTIQSVTITMNASGQDATWNITKDVNGNSLQVGWNKVSWNSYDESKIIKPVDSVLPGGWTWKVAKSLISKLSLGITTTNATDIVNGVIFDNVTYTGRSSIIDDFEGTNTWVASGATNNLIIKTIIDVGPTFVYSGQHVLTFSKTASTTSATISKPFSANILDKIFSFYISLSTSTGFSGVNVRFKDTLGYTATYSFPFTAGDSSWTSGLKQLTAACNSPTIFDDGFNYQNITTMFIDVNTTLAGSPIPSIYLDWITLLDIYNVDLVVNRSNVIKSSGSSYSFPNLVAGYSFTHSASLQNASLYRGDTVAAVVRNLPTNYTGRNLKIGLEIQ